MANWYPSQSELSSVESLERTIKRTLDMIYLSSTQLGKLTNRPQIITKENVTNIRNELQSTGSTPLNITDLPGISSQAFTVIQGTHAVRLSNFLAASQVVGTLFFETDRNYLYVVELIAGVNTWVFVAGCFVSAFANRPADLGANDNGASFFATDRFTQYTWESTNSKWKTTGGALEEPETDSTTAYRVRNAAGTHWYLNVDTINGRVGIGTDVTPTATLDLLGTIRSSAAVNSTTSFQFRDSGANIILNIDTTNQRVGIGNSIPAVTLDTVGIINASTGFRQAIGAGSPTVGHVLRSDGTNFVDGVLAAADLSNGVTGSGAIVLKTSPALTTPDIGAATGASLTVTGQLVSTVATGTAPLVVSSTTQVSNLNASLLLGGSWASPGSIGSVTQGTGAFTTVTLTGTESSSGAGTTSFGNRVAATATNGTGEAMKANVEGYLIVNVGGTTVKIPYVKN